MTSESCIGPNSCLITDEVFNDAAELVDGGALTPYRFINLCTFIEVVVLHERVAVSSPCIADSDLYPLKEEGAIWSPMYEQVLIADDDEAKPYLDRAVELWNNQYKATQTAFASGDFSQFKKLVLGLLDDDDWNTIRETDSKLFKIARELYTASEDYVGALFDAARELGVHAYAGSTELAWSTRETRKSVPNAIYRRLEKLKEVHMDSLLKETGYYEYPIPPFSQIVLSRCENRENLASQILRAREEFSPFRETCKRYAIDLRAAVENGSMKDIVRMNAEWDKAFEKLNEKMQTVETDRWFIFRTFDVVKSANPLKIITNILNILKEHDIDRKILRNVNGISDVWGKVLGASSYQKITKRLFRGDWEQEKEEFNRYYRFASKYKPVLSK